MALTLADPQPFAADSDDGAANVPLIARTVLVATLGGFMFGYDSGVINGTVDGLERAFQSGSMGTGFNVASILLGCAIGAFAAGRLADRVGRRNVLRLAALLFILGALGTGLAETSLAFVVARLVGGIAVGAASVLSPAYISEVTPARLRGRLSSLQQVMIIIGLTGAFAANYLIARVAGGSTEPWLFGLEAWRWMFLVQVAPAALFLAALWSIPESPRFLVMKGRDAEALGVLTRLFGAEAGARTLDQIRGSLTSDQAPRLADLLDRNRGGLAPIVWVGIGLAVFQQLVGINIVFYYGAVLWQAVGFSEADALMINVVSGAISILGCLVAIALIDRIGRKPLLLFGSAAMAVALTGMALAFSTGTIGPNGALDLAPGAGALALLSANAYVFLFNLSWGPVMWVMLGEMFPNRMRGSGLAVSGLAQWLANFGITLSFPVLLVTIGLTGAYALYALCAGVSLIFVLRLIQETRGRSLEEMQG